MTDTTPAEDASDSISPPPEPSKTDNLPNGTSNENDNNDETTNVTSSDVELTPASEGDGSNNENKSKPKSLLGEIDENQEITDDSTNDSLTAGNNNTNEDEKENNNENENNRTTSTSTDEDNDDERLGTGNVGYDNEGNMLPAFENVDDELLSFNSESDFAIFQKQLNGDIPLQRLVAVKRMVAGCPHWGTDAALSLIPRFASISNDKELVIRQTIAEQLGPFAKYLIEATNNSPKAHKKIIEELLPLMKDMLRDAGEIRQGAGNSLIMIAELLTEVEVHEHVLKIVLHMAHDDSDDQKITALPLLADLAPIVGHSVCRNYLSSDLNALSQDNSFRVRKSTVQYFGPICEQLGADDVEKALLPVFQQLCSDSIWSVRKGCVESFVDVANSVHQETRGKLIPIMEKFLNDSSRWVRNAAYEHLGPFLSVLTSEQIKPELVKYFVNIPHLSSAEADADCTNHCAFNFPAVAQTLGRDRWDELNDLYNILVRKTFKSRKTLACSIHEICKILGTDKTERYLMSAIEFFLKDIDDIREGIIKNLWKLLAVFTEQRRQEYISQLWDLASESDVNWRFRLLLAQQLEEVIPLYPPKVVYEQFVALTFQLCNDRMADVRYAAVDAVKDLINCFDKANQPESIEGVIKKCNAVRDGKTYAKRLLYIRICAACFGKIDKEIYDNKFFTSVVKYADDKIMNVRYCLARFIKQKLFTSDEYRNHDTLKKAIEKLKNDPEDVEVRRFFSTEDEIETFLRSYKTSQPVISRPTNTQTMTATDDMDDSESSLYTSSEDETLNNNSNSKTTTGNGATTGNDDNSNKETDSGNQDSSMNGTTNTNNENKDDNSKAENDKTDNNDDDDSSDSFEDEDDEDDKDRKNNIKLKKKLSNMDLEKAKDGDNPEKATGAGPDIADIGPDGRLVHQPTPFRLNIPDDDDDDDDDNDKEKDKDNSDNTNQDTIDNNNNNNDDNSNENDTGEDKANETENNTNDNNDTTNKDDDDAAAVANPTDDTENKNDDNSNNESNEQNKDENTNAAAADTDDAVKTDETDTTGDDTSKPEASSDA